MKAKRVSAWILALVMVLTLLPAAAFAEATPKVELSYTEDSAVYNTVGFDTLAEAFAWNGPVKEFTVTVLKDHTSLTAIATANRNITLDLNGKTVTGKGNGAVIRVREYATLTIYDTACDTGLPSKGKITGGTGYDNTYGGGIFVANTGTLRMYDGIITGNRAKNGGGVHVDAGGTFEMYGGEISRNTANGDSSSGGGVNVNGTFKMYGGEIIKNKAVNNANGGGVYVRQEVSAKFSVYPYGPIEITDNIGPSSSKNNVCLGSKKIDILESLSPSEDPVARIGVTMSAPGVFTSGGNITNQKLAGIFFSDNDAYGVKCEGKEAALRYAPIITDPTEDKTVPLTYGEEREERTLSVSAFLNHVGGSLVYQWYYSIGEDAAVPVPEANNSTYTIADDTDAGTYKYYCAVTNDNGVTAISKTFTVTIDKADPTANAPTGLYAVYGDTLADVTLTNPEGNTLGTWTWKDIPTTSVGSVGAHTFKANFTPTDADNYYAVERDVTVTVKKANQTITAADVYATYGDTNARVIASTNGDGALSYTVSADSEAYITVDDTGALTIKKAGTATVKVTAAATANYYAATKDVTVTISKASLTITVTGNKETFTYDGKEKTVSGYSVSSDSTALFNASRVSYTGKAYVTGTGVGTYPMGLQEAYFTYDDANVTATFKVTDGALTINAQPSYSGGGSSATTYKINLPAETAGGRLSVSPEKAAKGDKVTITAKSDEGYEAVKPTVTDKDGKDVAVTENADGSWSFTMPGSDVTVTSGFKKAETAKQPETGEKFADVPADAWYHDDVYWAVDRGVTTGADDTHFAPDADCTRAQFVTFLWRAAGKPAPTSTVNPFEDVKADAYYYEAVLWAVEKGVTNGSDATHFDPDAPVTRAQAMTFLYRYEQSLGGGFKGLWAFQLDFSDAADVPDWAYEAFCWMVKEGVCKGSDGMLLPGKLCPRCEVVALLARCFR